MKRTKVVILGSIREMLAELEKARKFVLSGHAAGVQTSLQSDDGKETVGLAGTYREDPSSAVRAVFKATVLRQPSGEDSAFQASKM